MARRSSRLRASTASAGAKSSERFSSGETRLSVPAPASGPKAKSSWGFVPGIEIVPGIRAARSLGGGNLFEVFRAWDERRLCAVVCKLVRPDQSGDPGALRILQREARLLARLSHPSIVRFLSVKPDGARPYLVLENVDAPTLRRRLRRRGPLPPASAVPLALQLGAALHYLAAKSVVHLDIKPANVILGEPARLIDFSLARSFESAKRLSRPVGTAAYMAPEQCEPGRRGDIGPAADIWGLGLTLYEALSGRPAFAPPAEGAPHAQLLGEPPALTGELPQALTDIVRRCLLREPAARPSAAQLVGELRPLAESLAARA